MSPRTVYELQLKKLSQSLEIMGSQVECLYDSLFDAMKENDQETISRIIRNDRVVRDMEREIESQCLTLITRQQPVASDLHRISAAIKVVTDLERVGDHVVDMAELMERLHTTDPDSFSSRFEPMVKETRSLLRQAVDAYIDSDLEEARKAIDGDDVIDDLFNQVKGDLIEHLKKDSKDSDSCVDVLMLAKYLEKIGDHAVNIGEWAIFKETGRHFD